MTAPHKTWNQVLTAGSWLLMLATVLASPTLRTLVQDWAPILRDVLSLGLAILGAYLAWRAIQMSRSQVVIASRQAAIAEREHERWLFEQSRRLDLRLRGTYQNRKGGHDGYGPTTVTLRVKNGGDKTANGFFWQVLIPRGLTYRVTFVDLGGNEVKGGFHPLATDDIYDSAHGHYPHKLFGWSEVDVIGLTVDPEHVATQKFWVKWRISCEDGGVPTTGYAKIHFTRNSDGMFATFHPAPNGDQDHEPDRVLNQETDATVPLADSPHPRSRGD